MPPVGLLARIGKGRAVLQPTSQVEEGKVDSGPGGGLRHRWGYPLGGCLAVALLQEVDNARQRFDLHAHDVWQDLLVQQIEGAVPSLTGDVRTRQGLAPADHSLLVPQAQEQAGRCRPRLGGMLERMLEGQVHRPQRR